MDERGEPAAAAPGREPDERRSELEALESRIDAVSTRLALDYGSAETREGWRDWLAQLRARRDALRGALRDLTAYHLTPAAAWLATPDDEPFRAASLATEGFIHLTHRVPDLVEVANAFYRDEPGPHVVLTVALEALTFPWRYDGDERFPHVYGPLDRAAILAVHPMPRDASGAFVAPEGVEPG